MMNDEYSDKIKNEIINSLHYYPSIFKSHIDVLHHMLQVIGTGHKWVNGELVYEYTDVEKNPPITREEAEQRFKYGHIQHLNSFSYPISKNYAPLFNIPDDVTEDWLVVIKDYIYEINKLRIDAYKIIMFGRSVSSSGLGNPHTYANWDKGVKNFIELQKLTNAIAHKYGWHYYSVDELHDPKKQKKHAKEVNKILTEILDEAEDKVGKSKEIIQIQAARDLLKRYDLSIFKKAIKVIEKEEKVKANKKEK